MTDFLGSRDHICHVLALDNVQDVPLPTLNVGVRRGYLKSFGHSATDGAELALHGVSHDDPYAMLMQAPRQRQRRGKTSNCQQCGSSHVYQPILPLCINMFTVFMSNNLYITLHRRQAVT